VDRLTGGDTAGANARHPHQQPAASNYSSHRKEERADAVLRGAAETWSSPKRTNRPTASRTHEPEHARVPVLLQGQRSRLGIGDNESDHSASAHERSPRRLSTRRRRHLVTTQRARRQVHGASADVAEKITFAVEGRLRRAGRAVGASRHFRLVAPGMRGPHREKVTRSDGMVARVRARLRLGEGSLIGTVPPALVSGWPVARTGHVVTESPWREAIGRRIPRIAGTAITCKRTVRRGRSHAKVSRAPRIGKLYTTHSQSLDVPVKPGLAGQALPTVVVNLIRGRTRYNAARSVSTGSSTRSARSRSDAPVVLFLNSFSAVSGVGRARQNSR